MGRNGAVVLGGAHVLVGGTLRRALDVVVFVQGGVLIFCGTILVPKWFGYCCWFLWLENVDWD
jgi:hypothetical protein